MTTTCSTGGCGRTPRPLWAMCDACVLDLLLPDRQAPARVARLSETDPMFLAARTPRSGRPDFAAELPLGASAGASRDEAVRSEAPDRAGRSRRPGGHPPVRPVVTDTHSRPGAEPQGLTRTRTAGGPRATASVSDAGQPDGDWAGSQRAIATASAAVNPGRTAPA